MKTGETIEYNGVMLEVAEESVFDFCKGCFFNDDPFCKRPPEKDFDCYSYNIIFKEVKKDDTQDF